MRVIRRSLPTRRRYPIATQLATRSTSQGGHDWKPGFIGGIVGVVGYLLLLLLVLAWRSGSIQRFLSSLVKTEVQVTTRDGLSGELALERPRKLKLDGSENVKVYMWLLEYLVRRLSGIEDESQKQMFVARLQERVTFIAQLDIIGSLVESHQYRMDLLAILDDLNSKEYPERPDNYPGRTRVSYRPSRRHNNNTAVRDALHADEAHLSDLLGDILSSDDEMQHALHLPVGDAERFINLIQFVLDNRWWGRLDVDPAILLEARRFLVRLSKACDILPSSLSLQGVELLGVHPVSGGGFADIFKGYYEGKTVALKRLRVFEDQVDEERLSVHRKFCHEALMWQQLEHPNLLPFLGVDTETFSPHLCIVLPWMWNGTILKHIQNNGTSNILTHVYEIAQAVEYLHSQGIIHGDLRGANILIDEGWHACLTDFGLASFAETNTVTYTSTGAGATRWMAPELHLPQAFGLERYQRTRATDVYSFACVCIELYTGRHPFAHEAKDTKVMMEIVNGSRPERPSGSSCLRAMPDGLWELVEKCWAPHFQDRPTMPYVVQHVLRISPASLVPDTVQVGSRGQVRSRNRSISRSPSRSPSRRLRRSASLSRSASRSPSRSTSRSPSRVSNYDSSQRSTQESVLEQTTYLRSSGPSSMLRQENLSPIQI